MRVLLTEGSGLTARQTATLLSRAGHAVEVLSCDPWCLCRFTRHVRRVHRVPGYGGDPFGWLDAALDRYRRCGADVLLPTQEQVAVLARADGRVREAGVRTAVPPFAALAQVQDKVTAFATLQRLGVPQPAAEIVRSEQELLAWDRFPIYLKTPIGTASGGVRRVDGPHQLRELAPVWSAALGGGGLLAQRPVEGELLMVQAVLDRGELVAQHANTRLRLGARGGASQKRGRLLPEVRELTRVLGAGLGWHGALSLDVILGPDGPVVIDVNPRLVEPVNAYLSGVDLVSPLLDLARGEPPRRQPPGGSGITTHQVLLAVLGAAQQGRGRRQVVAELAGAALRRGPYRGSAEELTPLRGDLRAAVPVAVAALATVVRPGNWQRVASSSVSGYALTTEGWEQILRSPDARSPAGPGRVPGG